MLPPTLTQAHGAMHRYVLYEGERLAVDNGHVVAWSPGIEMRVGWAAEVNAGDASWSRSLLAGEGWMCHFVGPGEVWVQTHRKPPSSRSRK